MRWHHRRTAKVLLGGFNSLIQAAKHRSRG
jgi:hypothetical protein